MVGVKIRPRLVAYPVLKVDRAGLGCPKRQAPHSRVRKLKGAADPGVGLSWPDPAPKSQEIDAPGRSCSVPRGGPRSAGTQRGRASRPAVRFDLQGPRPNNAIFHLNRGREAIPLGPYPSNEGYHSDHHPAHRQHRQHRPSANTKPAGLFYPVLLSKFRYQISSTEKRNECCQRLDVNPGGGRSPCGPRQIV